MTDERTPEQREADDQLHAAIEAVVRAYWVVPNGTVITNWMVLGSGLSADTDGELNQSFTIFRDNGIHTSDEQLFGMLRVATIRAERDYLNSALAD